MTKYNSIFQDVALLFTRLVIAAIFLFAAWAKYSILTGPPGGMSFSGVMLILLWVATVAEPLGAIGLILGLLTRWAATGLAIIMVVAIGIVHFLYGAGFFTTPQGIGFDYNLLILVGCLVIMAFGGGRWSVDALRRK